MPPHCLLEMHVSRVPYPLALMEPVIDSWNLRGLTRPREEWRLKTQDTLKGGEPSGGLPKEILGVISPGEELAPAVLVLVVIGPQVPSNLLDLPLSLAVTLRVVSRRQADRNPEEPEERFPHSRDELWTSVRHNVFGDAEVSKHMIEESFSGLKSSWKPRQWN
jgi:hypothetical protein